MECRKEFFLSDMVDAKPHFVLDLRTVRLLQRAETADVQRLKDVRRIRRHTQRENAALKAEVSKFSCLVATMAIKDQ